MDKYPSVNTVHFPRPRPGVKRGDRKPSQAKSERGRAEENAENCDCPSDSALRHHELPHFSLSQSQDNEGPRLALPQWVVCFGVRQIAKQPVVFISLFHVDWKTAAKPNETLWKTVSKTDGFALSWMSRAWQLIWHLAEVPQLTKHATQPARMNTANAQKLSTDGHSGCSKTVCY